MFEKQIAHLTFIVEHWELLSRRDLETQEKFLDAFGHEFSNQNGICLNGVLFYLDEDLYSDMVLDWQEVNPKASKSMTYPVSGSDEYYRSDNSFDSRNLYLNPVRLEFAKHCLEYLKNIANQSK